MPVTDKQKANLIPFEKNDPETGKKDKRINRKGRVTNFAQARKVALDVLNETITEEEGLTRLKALFRVMSSSRNPADRMGVLAYAVGKPKDEIETKGDITHRVKFVDDTGNNDNTPEDAQDADGGE